ncbi:site-2 protease family protein [Candidatus Woesearchaeota archaeon]|jgi:membrane-associated protease RseP (regulator of RpoE activity)|nr:site-2 protease family protein [Candidatus Woesearchaeota archaeon]MBT4110510.1 site-2 protease family protein [Candidatus Woesearchaeota archaeon]MBT4335966.1 site-2 protease family protein [Candidatus Woesearchaeota archaeon]MBT4469055.1 site-2 protease family protein [Candidatus Woesearchaeota archaeon]MBT6744626.1 site-2 protease family protein [Candidatus Woesearchaeota archaeon]
MFELITTFIWKYKFIFLFYLLVVLLLYVKRKKLDFQAKVIVLYRMKFGLRFIEKFANKFREPTILLGYIGVGAGYVGLIFISYVLIKNLVDLVISPAAVSGVSLVLPGVNIPGLGVLPFWYWVIAIFLIALVHEFSHGIVARAHKIDVKNTGIVFLGPIIGAFVEPNEKQLRKQSDIKQYSVLAAGSFSNILLAIVALLLLNFCFMPLQEAMVEPTGFTFDAYVNEDLPFAQAGIMPGTLINGIDGSMTYRFEEFSEKLFCTSPGDKVSIIGAEKNYPVTLAENPEVPGKSYLGIQTIHNEFEVKEKYSTGVWKSVYYSLDWLTGFLRWLFILSLGIGLFNLLPLPIVDGGRMMQVFLHKLRGEQSGEKWYRKIGMFFLLVLLLNFIYPLIRGWLGI